MRYSELFESNKRVVVWSGATINVIHNPSRKAFEKLVAERGAEYCSLRGLLSQDGRDIYLWDAGSAVHPNIIQELGLDRMECIGFRKGRWWGPNLHDEETGLYLPAIQRITPKTRDPKEDDELLKQLFGDKP